MLLASKLNIHTLCQIKRPDKEHIDALDGGDGFDVPDSRGRFDLDDHQERRVAGFLIGGCRDGEDMVGEGAAAASGTLGSEFGSGDDGPGRFLRVVIVTEGIISAETCRRT